MDIVFDVFDGGAGGGSGGPGFVLPQRKVGWERMGYVELLRAHGPVVVVDPRGFGDAKRAEEYSLDALCDDLLAAADAAGIERVVAFGYSNTALLATVLATRHVDRVVGLVCAGADPLMDLSWIAQHAAAQQGEGQYVPEGTFDWKALAAFFRDAQHWQADELQRRPLAVPAALVYGSDDPVSAPTVRANHERLTALGFTVHELDGLDHGTCVEAADQVVAAARHVLAQA